MRSFPSGVTPPSYGTNPGGDTEGWVVVPLDFGAPPRHVSLPVRQMFEISGVIEEQETGRPLADLIVRAFDRDLLFDDKLGFATSDADGRFEIRFESDSFRDLFESRPDLYLRVYDASGTRLLHETRDAIRWNASPSERYRIVIPARALDPSR